MNLHFTARKTDLTPEVRQYCEKRLLTLERLLGTVLEVDVILSVAKTRNRAEIHVMSKGTGLVVEEETHEMLNSLNRAFDSLENKIKKEREKFRERKRRKGRERKDLALPIESEEPVQRIVRSSKLFPETHVPGGGGPADGRQEQGDLRLPQGRFREVGCPLPPEGRQHRTRRTGMKLHILLAEDLVLLDLKSRSREDVLREIVDHLKTKNRITKDKDLYEKLIQRENLGSTAIGEGVAIPHCKLKGVKAPLFLLGVSKQGVSFDSRTASRPISFLLSFPPRATRA